MLNVIKKVIKEVKLINYEIENQTHKSNPIFKDFDAKFKTNLKSTEKSIEKIKKSIHDTKK